MSKTSVKIEMQDETFIGQRLQVAREFRNFTQKQLSEKVVASPAFISLCEAQKKSPSKDLVDACAYVLGFKPAFFYEPVKDCFLEEQCSFRHQRSMGERLKAQIRAHGTLMGMVIDALRCLLKFPKLHLPEIQAATDQEIETAAERSRCFWSLNVNSPINQIGRVLEHAGVIIVPHVVSSTKVDAFSRQGTNCVIFLNKKIASTSRWIFDIAHECGHLVMHSGIVTGSPATEAMADRFASAFLMPCNSFSREFRASKFSWEHVFELKKRWRVSAAAVIRRAYDLQLIGPVQYRQAYKYMSFKGWRTKGEPYEPPFQEPELLEMALSAAAAQGLTLARLSEQLNFTPETFWEVTGFPVPVFAPKSKRVTPFPPFAEAEGGD